jgi:hypothetical protein
MEDELVLIKVSDLKKLIQQCIREEIVSFKTNESTEILDTDDVARILKVSKGYVITLRKQGLPYYYLGTDSSSAIRYKLVDILTWMQEKKP